MKRLQNLVVNGGIKLPIGYRFCPTDEELVIHYLKRKIFAEPLPASVISDFDVFRTEPWEFPGDFKEKRYFFSNRKGNVCGNNNKIVVGSGYWKSIGQDKQIVASESSQVIGMRKTLIFCKGKLSHDTTTQWFMHELRLVGSGTTFYPFQMPVADFAVYRIFQKKKKKLKTKGSNGKISSSRKVRRVEDINPSLIEFTVEYGDDTGPPPPCSPCLSEGSEISSNKLD